MFNTLINRINLPQELIDVAKSSPYIIMPNSRDELLNLAINGMVNGIYEVSYEVPGKGEVVEASVTSCKNGISVNFPEEYMRRRDPDCLVIGDKKPTDKPTFVERFGREFDSVRQETLDWLKDQPLIFLPFMAGGFEYGYPALLIAPKNAAFFAGGLADLQGFFPVDQIPENFTPKAYVYLAPPFRHTHFDGKQVVVHNRLEEVHEVFSYNLYPGPSAKKGIYGVLLNIGEKEGWTTLHASTVKVITPYENVMTIMHEGASGGGKSEMIEDLHREPDGSVLLGTNIVTEEKIKLDLRETCELQPVTDDMALCPRQLQEGSTRLVVKDAEEGWFLRIDHIDKYGTDPHYERLCIHPKEPLIFLNLDGVPGATCLIWEHIKDAPGKPCPNPRVIMPRSLVPNVVEEPVEVEIRSFGVRTPPCTKENPSYGIIGFFHFLPPSLAWLWRLVAPRGYANPSIVDTKGMTSEGVGSYWPFATGRMVDQANLLLEQILQATSTRYILTPNQYVGAYHVGFMPQWITREYLARRGSARFKMEQLVPSRCELLGYSLESVKVDGTKLSRGLIQTNYQPEVGNDTYDEGARILKEFFKKELKKYLTDDLNPVGRQIIECCLDDGTLDDYLGFIPMRY